MRSTPTLVIMRATEPGQDKPISQCYYSWVPTVKDIMILEDLIERQ